MTAWLVFTLYAIESRLYPGLRVRAPMAGLGAAAVLLAAINIVGGFLVTQRMLKMFHR